MFKFEPVTPTTQDDFNILWKDKPIGVFHWKRNHPRPEDKVAVVRNLAGDIAVRPNEQAAQEWLLAKAVENKEEWAIEIVKQIYKERGIPYESSSQAT